VKLTHLKVYFRNAKNRAKRDNVPFSLVLQDLIDIATDECPIFHTPFVWGSAKLGKGKTRPDTPTLDRILPELGYIKSNVVFLSYRANRIKDNGTMQEHYDIADFIWNHIHAKEKSITSVPAGSDQQGEIYPELGSFSATGTWEDYYDLNHYQRTVRGEDSDYRTQTRGGDSVGHRSAKMGTPQAFESIEDDWQLHPAYGWIKS
jgi:hypothetical protein